MGQRLDRRERKKRNCLARLSGAILGITEDLDTVVRRMVDSLWNPSRTPEDLLGVVTGR